MSEDKGSETRQPKTDYQRRRQRRKWIIRGVLTLALLGVIAAFAVALRPRPVPVDLARASVQKLSVIVRDDGRTRVVNRFDVITPATGSMGRITIVAGDEIEEGQILTRVTALTPLLDPRSRAEARARVSAAQARVRQIGAEIARAAVADEQAARHLERQQSLASRGAVARAALERAQFEVRARAEEISAARLAAKVAEKDVLQAQAALGLGTADGTDGLDITAPVAGRVLRVYRRDAGLVAAGTQLLEVGNVALLEVVADVLTEDAVQIKPGAAVRIVRWGGDRTLSGRVERVEPSAFSRVSALGVDEQRVNVVIRFEEDAENIAALGDGYRVEAEIVVYEDEVLAVPASALFRVGESWAVFSVVDGEARRVVVEVGRQSERLAEIKNGVSSGDTIIVHPNESVRDGKRVTPR